MALMIYRHPQSPASVLADGDVEVDSRFEDFEE